jgi:hypothetical protein
VVSLPSPEELAQKLNTEPTDHFLFAQANMMQVVLENGKAVWKDTGVIMDFEKGGLIRE